MKKRVLTILLSIAVVCRLFTGCGGNTDAKDTPNEIKEKESSQRPLYGQVTNINGSALTLSLGNINAPSSPGDGIDAPPSDNAIGQPPHSVSDNDTDMPHMSNNGIEGPPSSSGNGIDAPHSISDNGVEEPPRPASGNGVEAPPSMPGNPAGGPPKEDGFGPQPAGEEREITVNEDTVYTIQDGPDSQNGSLEDISINAMIQVTLKEDGVTASSIVIEKDGPRQNVSENAELSGAKTIDGKKASSSDETFSSSSRDENAVLVTNKGSLNMAGAFIRKSGDTSNADSSNFYGQNAALAVAKDSSAELTNVEITSTGEGANALFATGENSSITADNVKIHTTGNSARGLDATYGGTIQASSVEISTEGDHCAALATDRGEGTIAVNTASLSTSGDGSPCIYSTGEISLRNATGAATGAQILVVEGKNSIDLTDCELEGAGPNGLMLYQSASGDARDGTAILRATDSKLSTISGGPMIYITNTNSEITLTDTELSFPGDILLNAAGNETNNWGVPGQNGGTVTLTGVRQKLKGDILCDAISSVSLHLTENSSFTGAMNKERTGKGIFVHLDDSSVWEVTEDSYITSLDNALKDCGNIHSNGHTVYYDASHMDNKWLEGQSMALPGDGLLAPTPQ